jgi:hypothetical protein
MPPNKCSKENCFFEEQKENWLDAKFLKVAGVILGLLTPLFVFIVVNIFTLKEDVSLVKQRQDIFNSTVNEIRVDLKEIKGDISSIRLNLVRDNRLSFNFDEKEEKLK